ncbi:MAG: TlpA disulfide reductase family protein [Sphingomonadales bacterium]
MKYKRVVIFSILHFFLCTFSGALGWNMQTLVVSLSSTIVIGLVIKKYQFSMGIAALSVLPFFLVYAAGSIYVGSLQTFPIWIWGIICSLVSLYLFSSRATLLLPVLFSILMPLFGYYIVWPNHFAYLQFEVSPGRYKPLLTKIVDAEDQLFDLRRYKGKVVLIDVWHSSCGNCIAQFPTVQALSDYYRNDTNVVVLTINYPLDRDKGIKPTDLTSQYTFKKLYFATTDTMSDFIATYVPITLILDRNLTCKYAGPLNTDWNVIVNNVYGFVKALKDGRL